MSSHKSSPVPKSKDVPPFLRKLYHMVEEPETNNCIRWNEMGDGFILVNAEIFARDVLPRYFKHNNFATFVRQLNMYDFSKVGLVDKGVVAVGEFHAWQFTHSFFIRGRPDLIINIHRKTYVPAAEKRVKSDHDMDELVRQLEDLHSENQDLQDNVVKLKQESTELKRQNMILMQNSQLTLARTSELHDTVEKILKFLATVYSPEFIRQQLSAQPALLDHLSATQTTQTSTNLSGLSLSNNVSLLPNAMSSSSGPNNQLVYFYDDPTLDALRSPAATNGLSASNIPLGAGTIPLSNTLSPLPGTLSTSPPITPQEGNTNLKPEPEHQIEVLEDGGVGIPSFFNEDNHTIFHGTGDCDTVLDESLDLYGVSSLPTMLPDSIEPPECTPASDDLCLGSENDMLQFLNPAELESLSHSQVSPLLGPTEVSSPLEPPDAAVLAGSPYRS